MTRSGSTPPPLRFSVFVARRVHAERIVIVCAARTESGNNVLAGLPELSIRGLGASDALALLLDGLFGPLDAAVCDQIVAESHGNPLALLALPRTWNNPAELAGGFGFPGNQPVAGKIEQSYAQRLLQLPSDTRLLALVAAAEPLGKPVLLHRAAGPLGLDTAAAQPAVEAGLLKVGARVEFAHPLVRSAAYRSATNADRHRVHLAFAETTDAETDPDRRAWHRARATPGLSEDVAAELERSAGRAQARGGLAAAAPFLQRSVALTEDPARRSERALSAAQVSLDAGAFDATLGLLATAESAPLDEFQRARVNLVRAHVVFASGFGSDAPALLMNARQGVGAVRPQIGEGDLSGRVGRGGDVRFLGTGHPPGDLLCRQALPPPTGAPLPVDLLLDGCALLITDGHAAAAPSLQRAAHALISIPVDDVLRWGWMATFASCLVWDIDSFHTFSVRQVQLVRDAGAVAQLPLHLWQLALCSTWTGDLPGAASLAAESESIAAATGSPIAPYTMLRLQALQGNESGLSALVASATELAAAKGRGCRRAGTGRMPPCGMDSTLRGGGTGGPRSRLGQRHPQASDVGAARARRGGRAQRRHDAYAGCPRSAHRNDNRATPTSQEASERAARRCAEGPDGRHRDSQPPIVESARCTLGRRGDAQRLRAVISQAAEPRSTPSAVSRS